MRGKRRRRKRMKTIIMNELNLFIPSQMTWWCFGTSSLTLRVVISGTVITITIIWIINGMSIWITKPFKGTYSGDGRESKKKVPKITVIIIRSYIKKKKQEGAEDDSAQVEYNEFYYSYSTTIPSSPFRPLTSLWREKNLFRGWWYWRQQEEHQRRSWWSFGSSTRFPLLNSRFLCYEIQWIHCKKRREILFLHSLPFHDRQNENRISLSCLISRIKNSLPKNRKDESMMREKSKWDGDGKDHFFSQKRAALMMIPHPVHLFSFLSMDNPSSLLVLHPPPPPHRHLDLMISSSCSAPLP